MIEKRKISDFFEVNSGDYHALTELDPGNIPLISCGEIENGLVGHFDIPEEATYKNAITVAYNGRPLTSKYHPYSFGAKDDVAVLLPRTEMSEATLLYVAAQLNNLKWRYSYGRKCFKAKLENLKVPVPVTKAGGDIDHTEIERMFPPSVSKYVPVPQKVEMKVPERIAWKDFKVSDIFDIERGDFHSLADLDPGTVATISRVTTDNGLVGYFDKPEGAVVYSGGQITVSTVGGDAFVQTKEFIASDNVLICTPKTKIGIDALFFMAFILNNQKWRYSYGRQPYKTKFENSSISLPINTDGTVDEKLMSHLVTATSFWPQVQKVLL